MKNNFYTLLYAAAIGLVCALVLTAWGQFTKPYAKANEEAEEVRNIMNVLGLEHEEGLSAQRLVEVFEQKVQKQEVEDLTLYRLRDAGPEGGPVAVSFQGPGLWGPVAGFLALKPDMRTIRAISFYKQEETPGLGGEIATEGFENRFKGRSIVGPDGKPGMLLVSGRDAEADNEVDAITGATMTSSKVQQMLNLTITRIVKETQKDVR